MSSVGKSRVKNLLTKYNSSDGLFVNYTKYSTILILCKHFPWMEEKKDKTPHGFLHKRTIKGKYHSLKSGTAHKVFLNLIQQYIYI
jgi:hypothetical protein